MTPIEEHAWVIISQPRNADMNSLSCFFAASSYRMTLFAFLPLHPLQSVKTYHLSILKAFNQRVQMYCFARPLYLLENIRARNRSMSGSVDNTFRNSSSKGKLTRCRSNEIPQ